MLGPPSMVRSEYRARYAPTTRSPSSRRKPWFGCANPIAASSPAPAAAARALRLALRNSATRGMSVSPIGRRATESVSGHGDTVRQGSSGTAAERVEFCIDVDGGLGERLARGCSVRVADRLEERIIESVVYGICFHGIGTPRRILEPGEERYWITIDAFQSILDAIAEIPGVRDQLRRRKRIRPRCRVCRRSSNEGWLPRSSSSPGGSGRRAAWTRVASLSSCRHGMTVGSHGMDHRPWRGLAPPRTGPRAHPSTKTDRRRAWPPCRRGRVAHGLVRPAAVA